MEVGVLYERTVVQREKEWQIEIVEKDWTLDMIKEGIESDSLLVNWDDEEIYESGTELVVATLSLLSDDEIDGDGEQDEVWVSIEEVSQDEMLTPIPGSENADEAVGLLNEYLSRPTNVCRKIASNMSV